MINRLFRLVPFIAAIVLLLCLFSCSPQKRLYRLLKAHPELSRRDTIWKSDTVITKRVEHDTTFINKFSSDTITIHDKQMTIKYVNDGKKVYIKGVCDTVRIVRNIPQYITHIESAKEVGVTRWWDYVARFIAIVALVLLGLDIYVRHK